MIVIIIIIIIIIMTMITRLSDDIALLTVDRDISLASPYVNTACLPSCSSQFSHVFSNGSGVRCHVAGWGKDEIDGTFQFIPKKVNTQIYHKKLNTI